MSGECQVNVKSQSELDIGGRETCPRYICPSVSGQFVMIKKVAEASSSWMKPLHVNHVTVFTKEQDQGNRMQLWHQYYFHFPICKVVPVVLQMFQTTESWEDQKLVSISIRG